MTTALQTTPTTFPLFPNLALELRNQIWLEALPTELPPALYFYKKGCWNPRIFTPSDPGYCCEVSDTHTSEDLNRDFEFCHKLLDNVTFSSPLLFVNHEARSIVLEWARKHKLNLCRETPCPILARSFDIEKDILYVPIELWDEFYNEPFDRSFQADMIDLSHSTSNEVTRIAVPEASIREDVNSLMDLYMYFSIKVLYIVVDGSSDLRPVDNDLNVQSTREFRTLPCGSLVWNDEKKMFEKGDNKDEWDESLYNLLVRLGKELGNEIIDGSSSISEIRPVYVVDG